MRELWTRGDVSYLLHDGQRDLHREIRQSTARKYVINCARRYGKSTLLCALAIEHCLSRSDARAVFAAPTRDQVRDIVEPLMRQLLADCPSDLRPTWREQRHQYIFANGAELHLDGADDDRGNHLRGPRATLVLADEVGFWRHARYVIDSILLPQTITCDGRIIIASTPPESVAHEFWDFALQAQSSHAYSVRTIHANPLVTPELLAEYARESGGVDSTAWRREYLCEAVTESTRAVVPEFSDTHIIDSYERPEFADHYEGLDLGLVDLTHCLFGYYDFSRAKLVIEDEICAQYMRTSDFADRVKDKERELWDGVEYYHKPTQHNKCPHARYSDNEAQQLYDLSGMGLVFAPALKTDKDAALNRLRQMFAANKIEIHKRCVNLIHQLRVGVWNARRTDYERLPGAGHLDGIDALIYMTRSINYNRNPTPAARAGIMSATHFTLHQQRDTSHSLRGLVRKI